MKTSYQVISALLLAAFLISCDVANAEQQVTLELKDETAYGSGGSISDELYYAGGIPDIGLFVGNPNVSSRNDRALFKYDISSLLLKASRVKKAELVFAIDYYVSQEPKLDVEVEVFKDSLDELTGSDLNVPDLDPAGTIEIVAEDAINGASGTRNVEDKILDVTEAVKTGLQNGLTTATFRLRIPEIESKGNVYSSHGLIISKVKTRLPTLQITLED